SVPLARRLKEMRKLIHCDGTAIAYVGRLSAEKNLETLLHAMARRVLPAVPGARLNIIGDGHRQKYERMAESLGISHAVAFAGPAPPELVGHLLSSCGLLAHPSLTETQGLVIAEAALVGLPAVVLDADLEGVVQHDHTGYVAASVDRFGAALVRLLQRPDIRNRLGANARSASAEYTSARYASRVVDVYNELVPGWAGRQGGQAEGDRRPGHHREAVELVDERVHGGHRRAGETGEGRRPGRVPADAGEQP